MNPLADNVYNMNNAELIGLAKNRFLDAETQVAIAKHHYKRAHMYLMENPGLAPDARDVLFKTSGYVNKLTLIAEGHYVGQDKVYREAYSDCAEKAARRGSWHRIHRAFIGGYGGWTYGSGELAGPQATPPDILEDIYDKYVVGPGSKIMPSYWGGSNFYTETIVRGLAQNKSTPTSVIVKISCSHNNESIRNMALKELGNRG